MNNSKAKIIAVANQKGGVAKTTSVINIGAGLALRSKKILLVDTDNQSHLSRFLGYDGTDGKPTISELIWQTVSKVQKPVSEAIRKSELGVDYIPSNFMLVFVFVRTGSIVPCIVFHWELLQQAQQEASTVYSLRYLPATL